MNITITGYLSLATSFATLVAVLGLWGRLYLMNFQFQLMWRDYCDRKGLPYNGQSVGGYRHIRKDDSSSSLTSYQSESD